MELLQYVTILRNHIWFLLLFVAFALLGTGLYTHYLVTPTYQASAKLIVIPASSEEVATSLSWDQVNTSIRLIATYKELIVTSAIMDEVAGRNASYGLTGEKLARMVDVNSANDTQVMTVRVNDTSYERAAVLANSIVRVFQEKLPQIMNIDNVKVLSLAKEDAAVKPVAPNLAMNLALGLFASVVVAIALVFLFEVLDDTIKSEDDVVKHLQTPALAVISKIGKLNRKKHAGAPSIKKKAGESYAAINQ